MHFIAENTRSTSALEPESTEICAKISGINGYAAVMFSFTCGLCLIAWLCIKLDYLIFL